ncbi:MAG: uroporphyrinogen decarboxylase family protein [Planctomycetota bacterium]
MSNPWIWKGSVTDEPCFDNLLAVLNRERPARPTLFEFYLNPDLESTLAGLPQVGEPTWARSIRAFAAAGYDYACMFPQNGFRFPKKEHAHEQTISLNDQAMIHDRASFEAYPWPDPDSLDYSYLDTAAQYLRSGQKLMPACPGGVLENAIALVGFEHLCNLLADDPELVQDIFDAIGSRLVAYYRQVLRHDTVGFVMVNDDWGFKTQTMLSPKQMRKLVFPWHERIVATAHAAQRKAVLHSCGNLTAVMDDIIDGMKFDGKHSYEDNITKVEDVAERWGKRIAILGGIDVHFMVGRSPREIYERAVALVARGQACGGYALGTGNSVPSYIPQDHYFAMIEAVVATRRRAAVAA